MGMYTAISLGVNLRKDTPDSVIRVLEYMTGQVEDGRPAGMYHVSAAGDAIRALVDKVPDHPLFDTDRWGIMLRCGSYYFDYQTGWELRKDNFAGYFLSGVSNLKNYSSEIDKFLDWLCPYINDDNVWIGWKMYEEDVSPTLIYRINRKIRFELPTRSYETLFDGLRPMNKEYW